MQNPERYSAIKTENCWKFKCKTCSKNWQASGNWSVDCIAGWYEMDNWHIRKIHSVECTSCQKRRDLAGFLNKISCNTKTQNCYQRMRVRAKVTQR